MAKKYVNPTKVVTGECRFSYANLWEAKAMDENSKPKYSVSLIIPKSDTKTIAKIKAAIEAAYEESKIKTPLRDGDTDRPDDEAYANSYFVNANSITAPGIVDADRQQILTHSEIYSGIYGRASITFYAFNTKTSRGIACGLQNVQKLRDGDPLGGHSSAEEDFADDEDFLD